MVGAGDRVTPDLFRAYLKAAKDEGVQALVLKTDGGEVHASFTAPTPPVPDISPGAWKGPAGLDNLDYGEWEAPEAPRAGE